MIRPKLCFIYSDCEEHGADLVIKMPNSPDSVAHRGVRMMQAGDAVASHFPGDRDLFLQRWATRKQ